MKHTAQPALFQDGSDLPLFTQATQAEPIASNNPVMDALAEYNRREWETTKNILTILECNTNDQHFCMTYINKLEATRIIDPKAAARYRELYAADEMRYHPED